MSVAIAKPAAGSTIGILGLGSYAIEAGRLDAAVRYFEQRGRRVVVAPDRDARHQRFAATDTERLAALELMLADPEIDIVMALRGGYGMSRLLDRIDFDAVAHGVRKQHKRFVGHSDFTAFQLGLLARTGAVSFAGPMASYDFGGAGGEAGISPFTEEHFDAVMGSPAHLVAFDGEGPDLDAEGMLWGGNLAMVCSLVGTPWLPQIEGGVLFLEDVSEHPYRVERMLLQLHHAGVLAKQRAILLGDFSGYKLAAHDQGYDLDAAVAFVRGIAGVPIVTGLPFGHCRDKVTLPVGGHAQLTVEAGRCRLRLTGYLWR